MSKYITEVYQDRANEWRWRTIAPNGNIVSVSSDGYKNFGDAYEMATKLNENSEICVLKETAGGKEFLSEHEQINITKHFLEIEMNKSIYQLINEAAAKKSDNDNKPGYRVDRNHPYYYPNKIQHSPEAHKAAAAFHKDMAGVLEDSIAHISKPENKNPNKRSQDRHLQFLKNAKEEHEDAMKEHLAKAGK